MYNKIENIVLIIYKILKIINFKKFIKRTTLSILYDLM